MTIKSYPALCFACIAALVLIAGCRKPKDTTKTKTDLITASPWKFSQAGIDQNNDGVIDLPLPTSLVPSCATDNLYTFKADSTGVLDEGAELCSSSTSQLNPFSWYFLNNETQINISASILPVFGGTATIVELTENKFSLSKEVGVHGFPSPLTLVVTLAH